MRGARWRDVDGPSQERPCDPYEDFIRKHLQHYGYYADYGAQQNQRDLAREHHNIQTPKQSLSFLCPVKDVPEVQDSKQGGDCTSENLKKENCTSNHSNKPWSLTENMTSLVCSIPRWPQECQVINEHIHHIEWSPPQPEPLYVNTKKEATPQCLGEQGGTVVYQADQTSKEPYFKGLRIGCSKGSLCQVAVELHGDDDETLLFEARFESGNLEKAVKVGPYDYELSLRPDLYTKKHTQWFYFRVNNTQAGAKYRFTITNMAKNRSLYNQGLLPLFYSEEDARQSCIGWRRLGDEVCYFRNGEQDCMDRPLHSLTWTLCFPHSHDTCYFSYCYPYTYTDLQAYLSRLVSDPARSRFCRLRSLCNTLCGNSVPLLTITAPTKHDGSHEKMAIVVTARVHPGETTGSWLMKGLMDFLLGDSHEAYILREGFLFKIVPMLNPDGVIVGNYRCSLTGCDLNRKYRSELKDAYPGIWHTRNMIQSLCKSRGVAMYFDLHGHSRKNNVFLYGCSTGKDVGSCLKTRVFPMMLSKKVPDQFCYKSCSFKVQKSKEGTGRVVMWRMGILNSFTVETTLSGSTLGNRKGSHFSTKDLESMGFHLCDTLLDYCISDHAKMQQCLKEVSQLCAEEEQEQQNLSSTFHSGSESSTSGSDSSESDGLPAHLQPLLSQNDVGEIPAARIKKKPSRGGKKQVKESKVLKKTTTKESSPGSRHKDKRTSYRFKSKAAEGGLHQLNHASGTDAAKSQTKGSTKLHAKKPSQTAVPTCSNTGNTFKPLTHSPFSTAISCHPSAARNCRLVRLPHPNQM